MTIEKKIHQPTTHYYIADPSYWPILTSIGLFCTVFGIVQLLHHHYGSGLLSASIGALLIFSTVFGWFGDVIQESLQGLHSKQMDRTYRWGMFWFIVSEVALFAVFFGALFYVRLFVLPEMSDSVGEVGKLLMLDKGPYTHDLLWPNFKAVWPLLVNPNPELFIGPKAVIPTWGIPAINTLLLLSSAVMLTWSHWALKKDNRIQTILGLVLTIALGGIFLFVQASEYHEAMTELGLTLSSGIYGATFFMLTGLHAMHVSMGVIMLTIILIRYLKGHFNSEHHFGYEAVAWYWHFVDVVWLFLFVFVYWF